MKPIDVVLPWISFAALGKSMEYRRIRAWVSTFAAYVVPFITLLVVNSFVVVAIRRSA
jgi:hypothetical protein